MRRGRGAFPDRASQPLGGPRWLAMRSWSPIRPQALRELRKRRLSPLRRRTAPGPARAPRARSRIAGSATTAGLPRLTESCTTRSTGADCQTFSSQRLLDLALLDADLVVGAVQDHPHPLAREGQQLERLQPETHVLERRDVEAATSSSWSVRSSVESIGPWKKGEVSTTITS